MTPRKPRSDHTKEQLERAERRRRRATGQDRKKPSSPAQSPSFADWAGERGRCTCGAIMIDVGKGRWKCTICGATREVRR